MTRRSDIAYECLAAGLLDQRCVAQRAEDRVEAVFDRQDEARGKLAHRRSRIHQHERVWQKLQA